MKTFVYIDAFNLYFGSLKNTPYRWLDIAKFCQLLLPHNEIYKIKYFTALVKARPSDPHQATRQQTYLRALRTIPNMEIILGHFLSHKVRMPAAQSIAIDPQYVEVIKTEEKGSDVNLATHLICDGYEQQFDVAVVFTNDSDLATPIRVVKERLGKVVGIINPHKYPSQELQKHASFLKTVRAGVLSASQFPAIMQDQYGEFHKPEGW